MPESEVVPMELYTVTSSPIPTNIVSATPGHKVLDLTPDVLARVALRHL